jgi:beta-galactosidase
MDVAILACDWTNEMAQSSFGIGLPSLAELSLPLHHHCYVRNLRCGFAAPGDDLSRVKIAFVPHLAIWDERWTEPLSRFVENGGTLVIGARTATRDARNHVLTQTPPGPLAGLCGVSVAEFGRLPAPGASSILSGAVFQIEATSSGRVAESARRKHALDLGAQDPVEAAHGYEILEPAEGTEVVARWTSRFLAGEAAITRRHQGAGSVIYVGTYLTHALVAQLFDPLFGAAGVRPPLDVPPGVEVTTRSAPGRRLTFVQNTMGEAVEIALPDRKLLLPAYGSTIMRALGSGNDRDRRDALGVGAAEAPAQA